MGFMVSLLISLLIIISMSVDLWNSFYGTYYQKRKKDQ